MLYSYDQPMEMTTYRREWHEGENEDLLVPEWCATCQRTTNHCPGRIFVQKGNLQALFYCTVRGCRDNQLLLASLPPLPVDVKLFWVSVKYAAQVSSALRAKPRNAYFWIVAKSRLQALYRAQQLEGVPNRFGEARYFINPSFC